jgi:Transposase IS116/IS110/IS902 family
LIPREESSGGRQKLGAISKQGNRMLRSLLVEAAQTAVQHDPGLRKQYLHRCHHKPKGVAKMATARKLAVRLYWMLRTQVAYPEIVRVESSSRVALVGAIQTAELIGRSRIPHRAGCSHRIIMVDVLGRIDGWWNDLPPLGDSA